MGIEYAERFTIKSLAAAKRCSIWEVFSRLASRFANKAREDEIALSSSCFMLSN